MDSRLVSLYGRDSPFTTAMVLWSMRQHIFSRFVISGVLVEEASEVTGYKNTDFPMRIGFHTEFRKIPNCLQQYTLHLLLSETVAQESSSLSRHVRVARSNRWSFEGATVVHH
jgi:hypothetical protein